MLGLPAGVWGSRRGAGLGFTLSLVSHPSCAITSWQAVKPQPPDPLRCDEVQRELVFDGASKTTGVLAADTPMFSEPRSSPAGGLHGPFWN